MGKELILLLFVAVTAAAHLHSNEESQKGDEIFNYVGEPRDSPELTENKLKYDSADAVNADIENGYEFEEPFVAEEPTNIENDSEGSQDRVEQDIQNFLRQNNNQGNVDYLIEDNRSGQKLSISKNKNITVNDKINDENPVDLRNNGILATSIGQSQNNEFETNLEDNIHENMNINSDESNQSDSKDNTIKKNIEHHARDGNVLANIENNNGNTNINQTVEESQNLKSETNKNDNNMENIDMNSDESNENNNVDDNEDSLSLNVMFDIGELSAEAAAEESVYNEDKTNNQDNNSLQEVIVQELEKSDGLKFEMNKEDNIIDQMDINSVENDKSIDNVDNEDTKNDIIFDEIEEQAVPLDSQGSVNNPEMIDDPFNFNIEIDRTYEDNISAAMKDLDEDLKEIFETVNNLQNNENEEKKEEPIERSVETYEKEKENDVAEYEEQNQKPYHEDLVLQQRKEYDLAMEGNHNDEKEYNDYNYEYDSNEKPYGSDEMNTVNKLEEDNRQIESQVETVVIVDVEPNENAPEDGKIEKKNIDGLTSDEVNDRMVDFAITHAKELDQLEDNFDRNIAPVFMTLSVDKPTIITSPDYPDTYPRNNIVDWVLDGKGMGIEMNVTDFSVDGYLGDYMMVQPGGIDDSTHDGLIFSYHLATERNFRFLDVDRMFIRFVSKPGQSDARGFRMSVKLVSPLVNEQIPEPEPEAIADPPAHTLLVFLGGLSAMDFDNVHEEFRLIVADMATMYVNSNGIEAGETNITQVTQITQVSLCNVNWPGFDSCVGVRFGVPLSSRQLTEEQLLDMWLGYVDQDPFAARLERIGVMEFSVPSTRSALAWWLAAAALAVALAALLGFALWRWGFSDEYTRMSQYRDSGSISSGKRRLELYPTPHQTLPPLYDDDFVKYDQRSVDGVGNLGYSRADDFESDDDVLGVTVEQADRYTTDV